jgi:sulfite exporter TauE/SafE
MVCFYHPTRSAVGLCSHCKRGLCMECATTTSDVLACRDRHEHLVEAASRVMSRNMLQTDRLGAGYARNAIFYALVGASFAALGLIQYRFLGLQAVFFILVGLFLLYAAAANYLEARRYW